MISARAIIALAIGIPAAFLFVDLTNWKVFVALMLLMWANNISLSVTDDDKR